VKTKPKNSGHQSKHLGTLKIALSDAGSEWGLYPRNELFTPRGEFGPQGVNFVPRSVVVPSGKCEDPLFAPPFFLTVESVHHRGWTKGWTFPLGANFTPGGELVLLKTGLRMFNSAGTLDAHWNPARMNFFLSRPLLPLFYPRGPSAIKRTLSTRTDTSFFLVCTNLKKEKKLYNSVATQWISNPPQEQKTWVQILPGFEVLRQSMAMLLCIFDLHNMHCLCVHLRNEGIGNKKIFWK
jgi:hypothetical protein